MSRNILLDLRVGGGSTPEVLYGEVSLEPTAMHTSGTALVLPAPTTVSLIDGQATIPDVLESPTGDNPTWGYLVRIKGNGKGAWSEYVRVPSGTGDIAYTALDRLIPVGGSIPLATVTTIIEDAAEVVVNEMFDSLELVTASNSEEAPTYPTAPSVDSLAFTDDANKVAFWVDGVGTPNPHMRSGDVLYPSGDATGATDKAAVNAALVAYGKVTLMPGQWFQNGSYVIPSGGHLHCEGPFTSMLVAGSNSNLVTNDISTTTCTDIALTGRGSVVFDGNGGNQSRLDGSPNYAGWKNHGIHFVNVDGLLVQGITWANTAMFGAMCTGVRNALWKDNRVEQDFSQPNQDGLDIGPACYNIEIDGFTGKTEDDVHSIFAKYSTSQKTVHPLYLPAGVQYSGSPAGALYSAAGNNTHDIRVSRSHVDAGKNYFRLQAAEGSKLYNIHGTDIEHTGTAACRALVILGEIIPAYITAPPAIDGSDFHDIVISGFKGKVLSLVYADSYFKDVTVRNAHLTSWNWLVSQRDATDAPAEFSRLVIDGVTSGATATNDIGNIVTLVGGMKMTDCAIRGVKVASVKRILANTSSTVANIELDVQTGSITSGAFFASTPVLNTASRLDVRSLSTVADWGTAPTIGAAVDRLSLEGA